MYLEDVGAVPVVDTAADAIETAGVPGDVAIGAALATSTGGAFTAGVDSGIVIGAAGEVFSAVVVGGTA